MIKIFCRISNPFYGNRSRQPKTFFNYYKKLSKNKSLDTQLTYFGLDTIFEIDVDISASGEDHAGTRLSLTVLGLFFNIQIYDHRHWDYDNNTWETYNEY